jgi:hypothetical protein
MRRFVMVVQVLIARATTTTRCIAMVLTGCCTSTPLHVLQKQAANYSVSRIAGPVPAAQRRAGIRGIAPTSREVMTRRRSTAGASNSAGLHSAGIRASYGSGKTKMATGLSQNNPCANPLIR